MRCRLEKAAAMALSGECALPERKVSYEYWHTGNARIRLAESGATSEGPAHPASGYGSPHSLPQPVAAHAAAADLSSILARTPSSPATAPWQSSSSRPRPAANLPRRRPGEVCVRLRGTLPGVAAAPELEDPSPVLPCGRSGGKSGTRQRRIGGVIRHLPAGEGERRSRR